MVIDRPRDPSYLLTGCKVYCGTVFDNYYISASNGEHEFEIDIYDTSGIDEYDELRPLSYPDTHAVCICFSINSPDSLENLQDKVSPA